VVVLVVVMVVVKIIYPRNLQEACKKGIENISDGTMKVEGMKFLL
jgi:hypothetical protein